MSSSLPSHHTMDDKPTLLISQSKRELFNSSNDLKQLQRRLRANWKLGR